MFIYIYIIYTFLHTAMHTLRAYKHQIAIAFRFAISAGARDQVPSLRQWDMAGHGDLNLLPWFVGWNPPLDHIFLKIVPKKIIGAFMFWSVGILNHLQCDFEIDLFLGVFKTKQTKRSSFKLGETGERYQLFLTLEPWDCALRQSSSSISSGSLSNRPIWSSSLLRCFNLVGTSELKSLWKIWRHDHDWSPSPSYSNDVYDSLFFCLFRPTFFVVEGNNTRLVNMDYCNFWHSIGAYSRYIILCKHSHL